MKTFKQWLLGCFGMGTESEETSHTDESRQPLLSGTPTTYTATSSGTSPKETTEPDPSTQSKTSAATPTNIPVVPETVETGTTATNLSQKNLSEHPVNEQDKSVITSANTSPTSPQPVTLPTSSTLPRSPSPVTQPPTQQQPMHTVSSVSDDMKINRSQPVLVSETKETDLSQLILVPELEAADQSQLLIGSETKKDDVPRPTTPPNVPHPPLTDLNNTPKTLATMRNLQLTIDPTSLLNQLTGSSSTADNNSDTRSSSSHGSSNGSSNRSAASLLTAKSVLPKIDSLQLSNNNGVIAVAIPEKKLLSSGSFSYASEHSTRQEERDGKNRMGIKVTDFAAQKRALLNTLQTLVRQGTQLYPEWWLRAKAEALFTAAAAEGFNKDDAMFYGAFEASRLGPLHPSKTKKQFDTSFEEWEKAFAEKITPNTQIGQPAIADDTLVQPIKIRFDNENAPGVKDLISRLIEKLNLRAQTLAYEIGNSATSTRKQSSGATKKITEQESVARRIAFLTTVNKALFSLDPNGGLTFEDWSILKVQANNQSGMPYSGALDDKGVFDLFDLLFAKFQVLAFNQIREEVGLVKPAGGSRSLLASIN